jgi:pimeloyl-ACP methyl ester carboxylesterase
MDREEVITTPDGRRLIVTIAGPEDGRVVFGHTGTPSGGRVFRDSVATGAERELQHVTYARPGYGDSDRRAGRSVADCVEDVRAIVDELGVDRFHTMGSSGGCPHALATAALLPDRVISAATVVGVAPHDADGLDWSAGMGRENIEEIGLAEQGEDALRPYLEREAEEMLRATPEELYRVLGDLVSDVDRQVLTGSYAEHMHESMRRAVKRGVWGWLDDDLAFVRPWGFDLDAIEVPVTVWYGGRDRFVPRTHGDWLAGSIPSARRRFLEQEGHLSLAIRRHGDVLDDMVERGSAV